MTDTLARMRQIAGATSDWAANDLVLGDGELAIEHVAPGVVRAKVGDGVSAYSAAPYLSGPLDQTAADARYVQQSQTFTVGGAAAANRWPRLGADGKLASSLLTLPPVMKFKGTADPTVPPPAGSVAGDAWSCSPGGVVNAAWGAPVAGTSVVQGDLLVLNDAGVWSKVPGTFDASNFVQKTGDSMTGNLSLGTGVGAGLATLEIGQLRAADGAANLDLHGSGAATDYEARLVRNAGVNGTLELRQVGLGALRVMTEGVADIEFWTNGTSRARVRSDGVFAMNASKLQMWHDGSNGYLQVAAGAGGLYLGANGTNTFIIDTTGKAYFQNCPVVAQIADSGVYNWLTASNRGFRWFNTSAGTTMGRFACQGTTDGFATIAPGGFSFDPYNVSGPSLRPEADSGMNLGAGAARWGTLFASNGSINTSDAREKRWRGPLTAEELAAARDLVREIGIFQWLTALEDKGEAARLHVGIRAQTVAEVLKRHGLDAARYGFFCFDEWGESEGFDAEGNVIAIPPGERYSLRTDQLILFMLAAQEQRLARLEMPA